MIQHALTRADVEALLRGDTCDQCVDKREGAVLVWRDKTVARPDLLCSDCAQADNRPAQALNLHHRLSK